MYNETHNPFKMRAPNELEKRYYGDRDNQSDEQIYLNNGYKADIRQVFGHYNANQNDGGEFATSDNTANSNATGLNPDK